MRLHPLHPMLVHAPIACWTLTPICDVLAFTTRADLFWHVGAVLAAFGVIGGALAATAGAMDFPNAHKRGASALAIVHASLMGCAWTLATAALFGRIDGRLLLQTPAPLWAIAASAGAFLIMIAGAWYGGEMVYGRRVGVDGSD